MSPREAFRRGMERSGERIQCTIDYDETFRFFSLPTTPKGTAQVEPGRGVKIHSVYYWSDEFRPATIEHTQVPVRYDPFDIGRAYAFAQMGGVQGNEPREKRLEEQAAPALSSPEQGQDEAKEDVYAGLEVYGEYR